ncbi:MAG: DoxX family membrane protein [bacterium]|nr:DoxX family membrane protein [bacterium]
MRHYTVEESAFSHFFFNNTKVSWFWLIVRLYVGYEWVTAGWGKVTNVAWVGPDSGTAISGFVSGALKKTAGAHPDVQGWYADFLQNVVLAYPTLWSWLITFGELAVGIGLILGALTGIAAFFGFFMNLNFLLAGTVSVNPVLLTLSLGLILAWKISGYIGVDRFLLPRLGIYLGKEVTDNNT